MYVEPVILLLCNVLWLFIDIILLMTELLNSIWGIWNTCGRTVIPLNLISCSGQVPLEIMFSEYLAWEFPLVRVSDNLFSEELMDIIHKQIVGLVSWFLNKLC